MLKHLMLYSEHLWKFLILVYAFLISCFSSKHKNSAYVVYIVFLKHSFWKIYHQKEKHEGERNHNYVLYMEINFSLALLSIIELDIKYRLNTNGFNLWVLKYIETSWGVVCILLYFISYFWIVFHLAKKYKTTERQEAIKIV